LRFRKDVAENEELVEEGVRQQEADIEEQRPSRTSGAATRTSTTRQGATVATA
jgi:hypothetical protein